MPFFFIFALLEVARASTGSLRGNGTSHSSRSTKTATWGGAMLDTKFVLRKRYNLSRPPSDEWDIANYTDANLTHSCANYTDDGSTVFAREGRLVLRVDDSCPNGDCLTSGRIMSKESFTYGLFTFSAKVPKCNFIWPALWLLPENKDGWGTYGRWPCSGEIDVLETVHDTPDGTFNVVSGYGTEEENDCSAASQNASTCNQCVPNYCTSTTMNWRTGVDRYFVEEVNCSASRHPSWEEHTFALSWQPGEIITYIDPEFAWDANGHLTSITPKHVDLTRTKAAPSWKAYQHDQTPEWEAVGTYMQQCFPNTSTANAPFDQGFKLVLNIAVGGYGGAPCSWGQSACSNLSSCGAAIGSEMIVSDISVWQREI
eukprot:CAMPEP_0197663904 /NCGR_PEP_ID=MMETSP1338-20131121/58312_1 /TAXON_ID=43686 ORGANISM="Pelagodinium beii, Strain RCC1491" /NCGR_SAMPLE_ID=MMETSP1338 /ASSEMBLY_ACC=CAM_ASM_000754 /LENGTH=370 /DNA_ID=CAMNT_0043242433 /DNA_START=21 /DNA_END=1133 /DNA_ORIENTATION=+